MATVQDIYIPEDINAVRHRFDAMWKLDERSGCWVWMGSLTPAGYGRFGWPYPRLSMFAHQASMLIYRRQLPTPRKSVCRRCKNRRCVNPDHLWVGSAAEYMEFARTTGRLRQGDHHQFSKLTTSQVLAIRQDERPQNLIAKSYEVSPDAISLIKLRKRWTHI